MSELEGRPKPYEDLWEETRSCVLVPELSILYYLLWRKAFGMKAQDSDTVAIYLPMRICGIRSCHKIYFGEKFSLREELGELGPE